MLPTILQNDYAVGRNESSYKNDHVINNSNLFQLNGNEKLNDDDPFNFLSTIAATTLLQSDRRRDAVGLDG